MDIAELEKRMGELIDDITPELREELAKKYSSTGSVWFGTSRLAPTPEELKQTGERPPEGWRYNISLTICVVPIHLKYVEDADG